MTTARRNIIRLRKPLRLGLITLGVLVLLSAATARQLQSQGNSVTEIGSGNYQFVGRIDQVGTQFTAYGYLYDIQGLSPHEVFEDPSNPAETTAHFTYYATATLSSRAVLADAVRSLFALDSVGEITFYYQATPEANFADPESFTNGAAVTTATVQLQDILTVTAPNRGLANGSGEFKVVTAAQFELGDETVRFGRPGNSWRVSTFGDAVRTDAIIPESSVLLAGDAFDSSAWPPGHRR